MEIGKVYKIWYKDAQQILRARTIRLLEITENLIEYENLYNGNVEGISISLLERFEKVDKYEGTKKCQH